MKPYTVIFLRPEHVAKYNETPFGKDTYVAAVESENITEAIKIGREEVYQADISAFDTDEVEIKRRDYKVVMVFEGHPKIALHGWQTEE